MNIKKNLFSFCRLERSGNPVFAGLPTADCLSRNLPREILRRRTFHWGMIYLFCCGLLIIANCLLSAADCFAQVTKLRGKVIDAQTKESLPFVNISFKGTSIGTITDFNGEYFLETRFPSDTIIVSYIGYKQIFYKVQKNRFQTIDFELETKRISLDEVVIMPGENPAHILLRKIIANRDKNNPKNLDAYQYEVYNKMEIDVSSIDDELKNRRVFRHFKFIFDYIDTSVVTGKTYLPLFISETLSDYYYRKDPEGEKEIIKANKISGIDNESVSQFTGEMYQNVSIYNNYVNVLNKSFVSPIADFGLRYYKYYLIDSAFIDNQWCYQISFKPKRRQEPTFTGDFWVHDTTFAIKKAQIRLSKDANINFVNDMVATQEYTMVNNQIWLLSKDQLFIDFNLTLDITEKTMGFFGRKTTSYNNFVINEPKDDSFYSRSGIENITILDDASDKDKEFWDTARHDSLTKRELGIYQMIDTIQEVPVFRTYVDIITMITTGYKEWGKFEIGPYIKLYSFNEIEGHRFRFGGRTSTKFSEKLFLDAYIAYGVKDDKFKYNSELKYFLTRNPYQIVGIAYKNDLEQLAESPNALQEDNLLTSVFRRNLNDKLNRVKGLGVFYEREWVPGFSNRLTYKNRIISPLGDLVFEFRTNDNKSFIEKENITTSEIIFHTRFAYNEKFIAGARQRISLGTKYPILHLQYTRGVKNLFSSDYNYHKVSLGIKHHFKLNPIGYTHYIIEAGKIFGRLPYPLLEMHKGNETYWYDDYSYSTMNYYEFVSDEYVSFVVTHHFDGYFFNKVPLFRRLKWREVILVKGVFGRLSDENKRYTEFPETLSELMQPYYEVGAGVENILKLFRVDALWRLTHLDKEYLNKKNMTQNDIVKFGLRVKLQISF